MDDLRKFRANLRHLIEINGITQEQLKDASGVSLPHINRILCGLASPSLEVCGKLAKAAAKLAGSDYELADFLGDTRAFMLKNDRLAAAG